MQLHEMSIDAFQARLATGEAEPLDWWQTCRERIAAREPEVQAWEFLGPEVEQVPAEGALRGVPVGIKDIIDTCDMPTAWGTGGYLKSDGALVDAAVVTLLQQQGALMMGKTVSTEFAYFTPGKTRNPHDISRTPGGSSSGSAAAVADGMAPLALGTQTAGSIIRPASYCGIYGFKPTFGTVSMAGIKPFAPSLDTLGWFARHIEDICTTYSTLTRAPAIEALPDLSGIRVGVRSLPGDETLSADVIQALRQAHERFEQAGASVFALPLDIRFDALVEHQKVVLAYEAAQSLASEYQRHAHQMGPTLVELIQQGQALTYARYREGQIATAELRQVLSRSFEEEVDVVLAASAPGVAPRGLDATGDPLFCRAWTLLGVPCLNLPIGQGEQGLPVGVQLIGDRYGDDRLLSIARTLMRSPAG
ncbi:amidase [Halomonas korlensis]|uniref:Asp-tRNAAsn/Glu-tRNAGln amidotransferase A subunit n=1 Tax=Halomonas korlensis TaxID=463301 RepID=A0A1I7FFU1_9GAMM|nr:amidase [Halomonas korlensis]SFU35061.1 Asp-tRNAAsn/Glu-tRNAGln amidotransferase A subunit [Halomonas korlensis]